MDCLYFDSRNKMIQNETKQSEDKVKLTSKINNHIFSSFDRKICSIFFIPFVLPVNCLFTWLSGLFIGWNMGWKLHWLRRNVKAGCFIDFWYVCDLKGSRLQYNRLKTKTIQRTIDRLLQMSYLHSIGLLSAIHSEIRLVFVFFLLGYKFGC